MRIPKILHYCSFGGSFEVPEKIISSWKKYCPDYEIMCWSEKNFDINFNTYVRQAYDNKKWAFVSDVARLWVLKNYGGIYLDTDVELTKSLDEFLNNESFWGFENNSEVGTAVIGAVSNSDIVADLLSEYENLNFVMDNGDQDLTPNVQRVSRYFINQGVKLEGSFISSEGFTIYPEEYFSPKDFVTGKINRTDKTCAIHHFDSSWKTDEEILRDNLFFKYKRHMPEKLSWNLASYVSAIKHRGFIKGHKDMFKLLAGRKDE